MNEQRVAKKINEEHLEGRRPRGGAKLRWLQGVDMNLIMSGAVHVIRMNRRPSSRFSERKEGRRSRRRPRRTSEKEIRRVAGKASVLS